MKELPIVAASAALPQEMKEIPATELPVRIEYPFVDLDADPTIPEEGWRVLHHRRQGLWRFNHLTVHSHLAREQMIGPRPTGHRLRELLADKATFNANLLDFYLAHREYIPEAWKFDWDGSVRYTYFWESLFIGKSGSTLVRSLYFDEGWTSGRASLEHQFDTSSFALYRTS